MELEGVFGCLGEENGGMGVGIFPGVGGLGDMGSSISKQDVWGP